MGAHDYLLYFKQKFILENKLDAVDRELLVLLFYGSLNDKMVKREIDGKVYVWVDYGKFLEKFPGLDFKSPETFRRKLENFTNLGIIEKVVKRNGEQKGTNVFIRFLDKFYENYRGQKSFENNLKEINNNKNNIYKPQMEGGVDEKIVLLEKRNKAILGICFNKLFSSEQRDEIDKIARDRAKTEMPEAMEGVIKTLVRIKYRPMVLEELLMG
ncbi:hypothetical protein [Cetobacterium sp. SF1]|uniref:hypothetical protein n=1 Tax=Cetobacterium sp. SF1 TaxID=3417654 RepID=UPI003CFB30AF